MNAFVILIVGLIGFVHCDVGYQYKVPLTSYDVPFGSISGIGNDRKYYHVEKEHFPTGNLISVTTPSPLFNTLEGRSSFVSTEVPHSDSFIEVSTPSTLSGNPFHSFHSFVGNQEITPTLIPNNFVSLSTPATILQTPIHEHSTFLGEVPTVNINRNSQKPTVLLGEAPRVKVNVDSQESKVLVGDENTNKVDFNDRSNIENIHQEVEVKKHLYFYSAPEEEEEIQARIVTPPPPAKKNVKILFIKTPAFKTAPIHVPALPQNEEKTLVYVLVKKPEEATIVLPTQPPTNPSKPEVFFIKYKNQKEADETVSNIQENEGVVYNNEDSISSRYDVKFQNSPNLNSNVNLVSKIASSDLGVTAAPFVVSTTPTPIPFSGLGFAQNHNRFSNFGPTPIGGSLPQRISSENLGVTASPVIVSTTPTPTTLSSLGFGQSHNRFSNFGPTLLGAPLSQRVSSEELGVTASPVVVSTTPSPATLGFLHGHNSFPTFDSTFIGGPLSQRISSSDDISGFDKDFGSSTTVSSLNSDSNLLPEKINVHQVYGPPQVRRRRQDK